MRVKLGLGELHPVYYDQSGFNYPDYDVEVPDELWYTYKEALSRFTDKLEQLKEFISDD